MDKGTERERGRTCLEEWAVTPARGTEGALHGEACRIFFVIFFYCFEQNRGFYSSGMAFAADRSQLLSKTQDVFASQLEGSILWLRLTSPAQPETAKSKSFSKIFLMLNTSI